jgi:mannitol-1-phosphate 5-dehydrogenase
MQGRKPGTRFAFGPGLVIGFGAAARGYIAPLLRKNSLDPVFCLTRQRWEWWQNQPPTTSYYIQRVELDWQSITPELYQGLVAIPCYKSGIDPSPQILDYGKKAHVIATAVGPSNLSALSKVLAQIAIERKEAGIEDALNILLVENLSMSGEEVAILKDSVLRAAGLDCAQYIETHIGFVDTVVETTIIASRDTLDVRADRLDKILYINRSRVVGEIPLDVQNQLVEDISPIRLRKMFIHNFSDTALAYLGAQYGYEYIHEALKDPRVYPVLDGALREIRKALSLEYPGRISMSEERLATYIIEQKTRMRSVTMRDKVSRIARDPLRKLQADERFWGPYKLAKKHGIDPINLRECIQAVVDYALKE